MMIYFTLETEAKTDPIANSQTGKCFSIKDSNNTEYKPPKPAPIDKLIIIIRKKGIDSKNTISITKAQYPIRMVLLI